MKKEPAVITEASAVKPRNDGRIVELGDTTTRSAATTTTQAVATDSTATTTIVEKPAVATETVAAPAAEPAARPAPAYAQLLVSTDQKTAEALAATLIDKGFPTAYVERANGQFKVCVKFASEAEARAAEPKLKEFAKDVWIVK